MSQPVNHHEQVNLGGMLPDGGPGNAQAVAAGWVDPMLTPENEADKRKILDWWTQARSHQADGRYQQALDEEFYDGNQWDPADAAVLEERGQPAMVFNQVKPVVDWATGTERRAKVDFHVFPRTEDDRKAAEVKTKTMKYVDDVNAADFHRSIAFKSAVTCGIGWLENGVRTDPTEEPIFERSENWRNMWPDHLAVEPDLDDGRFMFRSRYTDLDIAQAMFPQYADKLKSAARALELFNGNDDDVFAEQLYFQSDEQGHATPRRVLTEDVGSGLQNRRERVRLVECWYRKAVPRQILKVHDFDHPDFDRLNNAVHDPADSNQASLVGEGIASVYDAIKMEMWVAVFAEETLLQNQPSPYRHQKFPFTPIIAFRRKRDGAFYGMVRNMRDPQEDLNKRRSKGLHILNSKQVVADDDAVPDVEEAREQLADPNGWIVKRRGRQLEIVTDERDVAKHMQYEQMDREYVRELGGVTTDNLGHETNASSGIAIQARQREGDVVTTELFDNKHYALQRTGEKRLSLIEQFMSAPKQIRLVSDKGKAEFLTINGVAEGIGPTGEPLVENDITARKADFVIDLVEYRASVRQAMFDQLMEMAGNLVKLGGRGAELAISLMDLVFDSNPDLPLKDEFVARIRKFNGQPDPAMEGTPEQQAMEAEKKRKEDEAEALQKRAIEAEIAATEAKAALAQQQGLGAAATTMQLLQQVGKDLMTDPAAAALMDELNAYIKAQAKPTPPVAPEQQLMPAEVPPGAVPGPVDAGAAA